MTILSRKPSSKHRFSLAQAKSSILPICAQCLSLHASVPIELSIFSSSMWKLRITFSLKMSANGTTVCPSYSVKEYSNLIWNGILIPLVQETTKGYAPPKSRNRMRIGRSLLMGTIVLVHTICSISCSLWTFAQLSFW
jgi:hypothetical protein